MNAKFLNHITDDKKDGGLCPDGIYACPEHCDDFYVCYGNGTDFSKMFHIFRKHF